MKFLKKYIGIALILTGVTLLVILHFLHLTFINMLLLIPLFLMLLGTLLHVWMMKRESTY